MNRFARAFNAVGGRLMAASGRIGYLETIGRSTGIRRRAPLGFAARPDGSLIIAAGGPRRAWTANLLANPEAAFVIKGKATPYRARRVEGPEREQALAEFKARQGRFGNADWGDVFALEPAARR